MSNDTTIPLQENSEIRETEAGRFHSGGYEARVYATSPGRIAVQIRGRGPLREVDVETWHATFGDALIQVGLLDW